MSSNVGPQARDLMRQIFRDKLLSADEDGRIFTLIRNNLEMADQAGFIEGLKSRGVPRLQRLAYALLAIALLVSLGVNQYLWQTGPIRAPEVISAPTNWEVAKP